MKQKLTKAPVVILSTADFDATVWTNKQHIAHRLVKEREVIYIESIGLREPSVRASDMKRIATRLLPRSARGTRTRERAGIKVISPRLIPYHRFSIIRLLNARLFRRIINSLPERFVLWTFSPVTYGLTDAAEASVYHSVDLLHELPRIPSQMLIEAETALVKEVDAIIASSSGVRDHLLSIGADEVLLWPNVADVELFQKARRATREQSAIFAGNMTGSKIAFELLEEVVARGIPLKLAGPIGIDGGTREPRLNSLLNHPGVEYLGTLQQSQLAEAFGKYAVGLIPYAVNGYTTGVFPMKVYEYLASGLWVVSTDLPSLSGVHYDGLICVPAEEIRFADAVSVAAAAEPPPVEDLSTNSWSHRVAAVDALLDALRMGPVA